MPKRIEPVDVFVGRRIRAFRLARQMSQSALAEKVGVTFQQIQKYEKGTNRITSSRLQKVATVLGLGIGTFFAEEDSGEGRYGRDVLTDIIAEPNVARLLAAYGAITKVDLRLALVKLAEGLAANAQ